MKELSTLEQLCFSTTRIETEDAKGNKYSGTGFFFNLRIDDKMIPIVVTNKHVVKGMTKGAFLITESDSEGNPVYKNHFPVVFEIDFEKMWIMHPDDHIDLCVLPYHNIVEAARKVFSKTLFYRAFDNTLIPTDDILEDLDVVENILMIGYPNGLWDSTNNMPIIRRGTTATDIKLDHNGKQEFVIDAACFPGSSGSPIILFDKGGYTDKKGNLNWGAGRLMLLGILYAGPQLTVTGDIQIVTIPTIQQKAFAISHIPNNLGYIIKSQTLLDFIPIFKNKYSL